MLLLGASVALAIAAGAVARPTARVAERRRAGAEAFA